MGRFLLQSPNLPQGAAFYYPDTKPCQGVFIVFILALFGLSVKALCYTFFMARKLQIQPLLSPLSAAQIGRNLAAIRKSRGLTQTQLAELIGIRQRLVSDYEIGSTSISAEMISRFCHALHCSASDIITVESAQEKTSLRLMKRMNAIDALPETTKKYVIKFLDDTIKANI